MKITPARRATKRAWDYLLLFGRSRRINHPGLRHCLFDQSLSMHRNNNTREATRLLFLDRSCTRGATRGRRTTRQLLQQSRLQRLDCSCRGGRATTREEKRLLTMIRLRLEPLKLLCHYCGVCIKVMEEKEGEQLSLLVLAFVLVHVMYGTRRCMFAVWCCGLCNAVRRR